MHDYRTLTLNVRWYEIIDFASQTSRAGNKNGVKVFSGNLPCLFATHFVQKKAYGRMRRTSQNLRHQALACWGAKRLSPTARQFGVSRQTVRLWLHHCQTTGTVSVRLWLHHCQTTRTVPVRMWLHHRQTTRTVSVRLWLHHRQTTRTVSVKLWLHHCQTTGPTPQWAPPSRRNSHTPAE